MELENLQVSDQELRYYKVIQNDPIMRSNYLMLKEVIRNLKNEWANEQIDKAPLLSIQEVAVRFKVTKATIHNWIKRGIITGKKMGKGRYFDEKEVRDSIDRFKGYIVRP